jgi:hypothetical protein
MVVPAPPSGPGSGLRSRVPGVGTASRTGTRRAADARAAPGRPAGEEAQVDDPARSGAISPAAQTNTKWYGDGTEIPTDEGKPHLAAERDMRSRRLLGLALREQHDAPLASGALAMAVTVHSTWTAHALRQLHGR